MFTRAAVYIALITAIYWFVSYEKAGTILLAFLFGAAVLFVVTARFLGRKTENVRGSFLRRAASVVALDDEGGEVPPTLGIEEEPVVTTSPWPLGAALAAMLIGLGLLYGPWLWIPGTALALSVAYGWVTQTDA